MYSSPYTVKVITRSMRLAELVARLVKKRNTYRILGGKINGKRQFLIPKRKKEDNIKMNLKQDGRAGIKLIS
jgi:hypothetical protein